MPDQTLNFSWAEPNVDELKRLSLFPFDLTHKGSTSEMGLNIITSKELTESDQSVILSCMQWFMDLASCCCASLRNFQHCAY